MVDGGIDKSTLRLKNLQDAFQQLKAFSQEDLTKNIAKAGFIKAFEFTFELCWKTIKAAAEEGGLEVATPRDALRAGLQMRLIDNEPLWLQMQKDRNTTAHTYSADYAQNLLMRVKDEFIPAIAALISALAGSSNS